MRAKRKTLAREPGLVPKSFGAFQTSEDTHRKAPAKQLRLGAPNLLRGATLPGIHTAELAVRRGRGGLESLLAVLAHMQDTHGR